jgi:hypothetical protein
MPDKTTMNLYACDAAYYSNLQYELEKRTFQLRKEADIQREQKRPEFLNQTRK